MKKLIALLIVFSFIVLPYISAETNGRKPVKVIVSEIPVPPVLAIDQATGQITNTATPSFGVGEIKVDISNFKSYKKEIKFSEQFISQPEDNKMIVFIISIDDKNKVVYVKESDIKKNIKDEQLLINFMKIPLNTVSMNIVLLEKGGYSSIPIQLVYKNRKVDNQIQQQDDDSTYEYTPPIIGH